MVLLRVSGVLNTHTDEMLKTSNALSVLAEGEEAGFKVTFERW